MKAARLVAYHEPLQMQEVPMPKIEDPMDVIVKIAGAGVCRTDLHLLEAIWEEALGHPALPYTIGHENAGWIAEVGSGVSHLHPGDAVILHPLMTCGFCRACRAGNDMHCENSHFPGLDGTDGGYAEYLRTSARSVVKLPEGTDPADLAPFADAGITAYHAVKKLVPYTRPGTVVAVVGIGGLGHFAVQILKALTSATVVAVDLSTQRLDFALSLGADDGVRMDEPQKGIAALKEKTEGRGADVVLDFVGEGPTPTQALAMLRKGGLYSIVGYGGQLEVPTLDMINREWMVFGNLVGTYNELVELMELNRQGKVRITVSKDRLSNANQVLQALDRGEILGRAILVP